MALRSYSLAVVAAVNNDKVLRNNLAMSPIISEDHVPLITERGYRSAGMAYNAGLDKVTADIVIFAHQDVYLPRGWDKKLLSTVHALELNAKNWGILGVIGVNENGDMVGTAWSTGLGYEIKAEISVPAAVGSLDEIVIVLRRGTGLRFDEDLSGYHLYGTDIVQNALQSDFGAYVFNGPVIHNSNPKKAQGFVFVLDRSYVKAYRYLQRKWKNKLPIVTLIVPITKSGWPLLMKLAYQGKKYCYRRATIRKRDTECLDPKRIAQDLGYEEKDGK